MDEDGDKTRKTKHIRNMKTINEPIEVSMEREPINNKEKLNKVYELMEELGLTPDEVYEGLEDKMDVYYSDYITYGSVICEFIADLKQHNLTDSQINMLEQLRIMTEQGSQLPRDILNYLIEEDELEIDGRRILLDNEWYLDHFEYEPEEVISTITSMMRDKKISDIGI